MNKIEMIEAIVAAKTASGMGWEEIAEKVGLAPVFLTSACLGMNTLRPAFADKVCEVLELPTEVSAALQVCPHKEWDKSVPTDPLIYRFYEVVGVYGDTLKELIHEKFGDGIMSAIDFTMHVDKEENPAGDRVVVTMNGKFLPYKCW
jgi:cyanate lyase